MQRYPRQRWIDMVKTEMDLYKICLNKTIEDSKDMKRCNGGSNDHTNVVEVDRKRKKLPICIENGIIIPIL